VAGYFDAELALQSIRKRLHHEISILTSAIFLRFIFFKSGLCVRERVYSMLDVLMRR